MKKYDYSKLKGRIKEYYGTQKNFADSLGISEASVNYKLNNKCKWDQDEIYLVINRLNITSLSEFIEIFFTEKVEKN